jgi:aryl-alcohol dehydrogenase-like predicted oxidoreductase
MAPGVAPSPDGPTIIPIARDPSQSDLRAPGFARAMERLVSTLGAPVWGAAWTSGTDAQLCAHDALALGARLIGLPISLLSFAAALEIGRKATDAGAGLVGLDPMAGGALDGSFLTGSPLERDAGSRPSTLGELTERLGPITQLGFLTEGRRRTLPQAAVRFVLDLPAVVSVSCDIRSPATILELASVERVPSLSDEELDRVSRLGR